MRLLVVSPTLPLPATSGGALRILNLVRRLAVTEDVEFLTLDAGEDPRHMEEMRAVVHALHRVHPRRRSAAGQVLTVGANALRGIPFYTKYVDYPELRARLFELTGDRRYDAILFEHSHLAGLLDALHPHHRARLALTLHNLGADQYRLMFREERNPIHKLRLLLTWWPMRRWEPRMATRFDQVICVSEPDRERLLQRAPGARVAVVPNGVDTVRLRPLPFRDGSRNILMVGSLDYEPNVEAARYFSREIFPRVRARYPDATFTVVGRQPPPGLRRIEQTAGVRLRADVDDVQPFYADCACAAVALRSGGGTRLKILEAFALGRPVVSTSLGGEGLRTQDGVHLLIADDPAGFADRIGRLFTDRARWEQLARNGRALVEQEYDWSKLGDQLLALLRNMAGS
jgi:glycosyltransferase involved in cell wall biosynthesis